MRLPPPLRGEIVRRIQEKQLAAEMVWEPVSVPMARFTAFEQMARSVTRRRRFRAKLARKGLRTTNGELLKPAAQGAGALESHASNGAQDTSTIDLPRA